MANLSPAGERGGSDARMHPVNFSTLTVRRRPADGRTTANEGRRLPTVGDQVPRATRDLFGRAARLKLREPGAIQLYQELQRASSPFVKDHGGLLVELEIIGATVTTLDDELLSELDQ